jgi:hypothetical protein
MRTMTMVKAAARRRSGDHAVPYVREAGRRAEGRPKWPVVQKGDVYEQIRQAFRVP